MSAAPGDARAEVLRRVRLALGESVAAVTVPRSYATTLPPGTDVLALFAERLGDYAATVHRTTGNGLANAVGAALARRNATDVAIPPGLPAEWLAQAGVVTVADAPPLSYAELDALDGVITGCAVAIAETGTIILDGGRGQGRRVLSLLPDYHLCVVRVELVVGTVPEAIARLDDRSPQTWISGPSATSDIELRRVEGVHGPRNLEVILVDEGAG